MRVGLVDCRLAISSISSLAITLWIAALALALPALAQEIPHSGEHITIEWNASDSRTQISPSIALSAWTKACNAIANRLEIGKGVWGYGVFSSNSCTRDGKVVSGKKSKFGWHLQLVDREDVVALTLKQLLKNDQEQIISTIELPASQNTLNLLAEPTVADLLAHYILESMPMSMQVRLDMIEQRNDKYTFKGRAFPAGNAKGSRTIPRSHF